MARGSAGLRIRWWVVVGAELLKKHFDVPSRSKDVEVEHLHYY